MLIDLQFTGNLRRCAMYLIVALASHSAQAQGPQDDPLITVAESSDFTATATGEQVLNFLVELEHQWDAAELHTIGSTVEGRPIQGLVVQPKVVSQSHRPLTVLILGGIHPGECDGKESLLAFMRDLARDHEATWFKALRLIFVPNFNADGDARRGLNHRPGQVGPTAGTGIRENAQGLDLNRDFIKLETPECRSLVAALNEFDVDLLIDLHTTNGSLHRYQLTYDLPHNPALPASLDQYLRRELLPWVTEKLTAKGFDTYFYGNFDKQHRRWESYGHEPRYSTEYMGLRGKMGILVESYAYATYETRFLTNYAFIDEVLHRVAADQQRLVEAIDAQQHTNLVGSLVPIAAELAQTEESVKVLGYQTATGQPPIGPFDEKSAAQLKPHDYYVSLWNQTAPTKTAVLPAAYAIDSQYAWAVSRLQRHGVTIAQLTQDVHQEIQLATITAVTTAPSTFQGHKLQSLSVQWKSAPRKLPAGTYIIPATGPLARLVAYLCEPESDESLATWNFLDPYLSTGAEYPIVKLTELPMPTTTVQTVKPGEVLTVENVMKPGATIHSTAPTAMNETPYWLPAGESVEYVQQQQNQLLAIEAATGAAHRLTAISVLEAKLTELNAFSREEAKAAINANSFWRTGAQHALIHHKNDLYYYDVKAAAIRQITHTPELTEDLAQLNPSGSAVAFVRNNNLWLVNCETTELRQLTKDGTSDRLNGVLDWVYQEELYGRGNFKAFWWSPDGLQIAYLQLDQTEVPEYVVPDNVSVAQSLESTRYPKAGQPLPVARAFIINVRTGATKEINLGRWPVEDRLIGRVTWSPQNELWLQVLNRVQSRQELVRVDPVTGNPHRVLKEESPGWVEIRGAPVFLRNGDFLWLSDVPSGRTQLFHVDATTGNRRSLTSGAWDVAEIRSLSHDERYAFVSGNLGNPIESQLISVDLITGVNRQITTAPGTHEVSIDPTSNFFIDTFSNISTPAITTLHTIDGTLVRVLSTKPNDRHEFLKIQQPQLMTIEARDGLPLQTMVLLPHGVAGTNDGVSTPPTEKLPVLFFVYGGPQSPTVKNSWQQGNYWWHQALCSQGYAVVLCDNRSARGRGVADTWAIRGNLGRVELQDLEDAAAWVSTQAWADPQRFGIWGWSYGGYFTAYAMTHTTLFKAGISGAPVTDWRNYDAIYTERYMDLPEANPQGYKSSSVVESAPKLHGRLLLIHGERDDNVHLSNTIQLVDALQNAGKQFELMIYPKARHAVVDAQKRFQMYQMMTEFLDRNLKN